ncbi:glycosyltransferase family 9 protein [Horticoccus luteus]|uniref:Glycosyltransferase family 9 protein n=1 Tax=Horticoccus luteus TaxID=2862869 RepID=A0A8F9TXN1_9BACT|nr:glycosyltransferase family 9 protein [Horticoccus luteus]QYM80128.1 glycosyltransferase family 9 protein [Horticoccus luteus]
MPPTRILVLRGGALGDFIVTLPALQLLRRVWPAAPITLVGNARAAALGQTAGVIDRVCSQSEARWSALYASPPLPSAFADELAAFDLVLNFWPDPDGELARHFPRHPAQRFLTAPSHPAVAPAAAHYCAALHPLGLTADSFRFPLGSPSPDARLVAVHPGSGSPRKNWPLDRWHALCLRLREIAPTEFLIVTGDAEPDPGALANFGRHAHALPLPQLVAALRECRLFLGHDSGISHLAAACGVPCVLLFGPTDPAVWSPPGEHVHALRRGSDLSTITVDDVLAAARPRLIRAPLAPPSLRPSKLL